jgi:spermidine/putrescine transport system substrate-binding protein
VPPEGIGWSALFQSPDPKHTALLDDMREVFAAALRFQGKVINTTDHNNLAQAAQLISRTKNEVLLLTSEPKPLLLSGELHIAHIYSSDGLQAAAEDSRIRYVVPREGGVIWTDNFAIPHSSKKIIDAHRFINFLLDPVNAELVVNGKWLATPNTAVRAMLPKIQLADPGLYPSFDTLKILVFLDDIGETLPILNRLWTELKSD